MLNRRDLLSLLLAGSLMLPAPLAFADDGGGGGGDGGGGDGGGGDGGGGDGGGGNSGPGGGGDDGDEGYSDGDDQAAARDGVKAGQVASLKKILAQVRSQYPGEIVSVNLRGKGDRLSYRIKIIDRANRLINLRVDARTGKIKLERGV
jgi:Peptidase propeptide and YPEB domain